ncbi:tRNA (adenosine(37)-N6)-dimethylallyltransferase MiaA [Bacteroidota bacterium]
MERRAVLISGPTCSGKTTLSILLAEILGTEIISADSRQIYKYLNIGTAKPTRKELGRIKHHFVDYIEPDEEYNASRFEFDSLAVISTLQSKGKIPVITGGSGLYIKSIVDGILDVVSKDDEYRINLLNLRRLYGNEHLYKMLIEVDPVSADKMLPQNWKRIIRALEVHKLSGKPIWQLQNEYKRDVEINFIQFGLLWERSLLYERINKRVDNMISNGLVDEVKSIINKGYSSELNSLNTVGYKEVISYLKNDIDFDDMVNLIKRNSRRYAKRQLTWFRNDNRIHWLEISNDMELEGLTEKILSIIYP